MKIRKKNLSHWLYLISFGTITLVSIFLRIFNKKKKKVVILYGHKLNSNLKGIYDYSIALKDSPIDIYFLTMDPSYYRKLKKENIKILLSSHFSTAKLLAQSTTIISDHGLHILILLLKFTNIKFIDVWHGIPFKGFDSKDFSVQRRYDEIFVTSKFLKQLYVKKFSFNENTVHETGYARTDVLINKNIDISAVKKSMGLEDLNKKTILFAPTWQQDENNRNIFPFETSEESFLTEIDKLSEKLSVVCVFRTHLNTAGSINKVYKNIKYAPHSMFPNTEEILLTADIMVCDWSSIAFDYLLLNRPTIFLDIPAPFKKGFSLDKSYRFGHIVGDLNSLLLSLESYIKKPESYQNQYYEKAQKIKSKLYDNNADGFSARRCFERLSQSE